MRPEGAVTHPSRRLQAQKGYNGFLTELQRCERLGLKMYNFHPGSTTGLCTHEDSMDRIAGASLDRILRSASKLESAFPAI